MYRTELTCLSKKSSQMTITKHIFNFGSILILRALIKESPLKTIKKYFDEFFADFTLLVLTNEMFLRIDTHKCTNPCMEGSV